MNIKLPYSWIKDYLKTDVAPETVFDLVTSTGPTVERIKKIDTDYLLDIEVTINRPDCLSVLGIAREMYAVLLHNGHRVKLVADYLTNPPKIPKNPKLPNLPLTFSIDPKLCPRFCGVLLKDIKIGNSPQFIIDRLAKSGMRSLNNVIDITNFLMLELGQPNHAFDFTKIKPPKLTIRGAKKGETVKTLDEKVRSLDTDDIIYEDGEGRIIDLAGIMGGFDSEIDNQTTSVLFTVVNDYFAQIRKTSMRLGIQTEASARLSKVLNQEVVWPTILRGIELFQKYAGAKIASEIFDFYPKKQNQVAIELDDAQMSRLNGITILPKTTDSILTSLGFKVRRTGKSSMVTPPIWRLNDIQIWQDLAEEVARIYNYDTIPNQTPSFALPIKPNAQTKKFLVEDKVRQTLVAWGITETMSFSMLSYEDLTYTKNDVAQVIKIANPLSSEWEYMQPSLLANAIKNLARNQNYPVSFFEIANVFDNQGKEERHLILSTNHSDFYFLQGLIRQLLTVLRLPSVSFAPQCFSQYESPISSTITASGTEIGTIGQVATQITTAYGIPKSCFTAEINLDCLIPLASLEFHTQPQSKSNPIIEDLCFEKPSGVSYDQIEKSITATEGIEKVEFMSYYQNRFTFQVYYNLKDKQISSVESSKIRASLIESLAKRHGVKLRTE